MSYIKVYIHYVWSTKNRFPYLTTRDIREKLWKHILQNARQKGIFVDMINGYTEHCHCLVSLNPNMTIQKTAQLIKGESSYWVNHNEEMKNHIGKKFHWQDDYYATSISYSHLERVRNYIANQEIHHKRKNFDEEIKELIEKYDFKLHKRE